MIFFAFKKSLFHRILRKQTILRIKLIHLIMQIFRKFHRRKVNTLCKVIKIMTSSYRHIVMVTKRINKNFDFFLIFNIMAIWSPSSITTTAMEKK